MNSKRYEITVVGKQVAGSDKVTFINPTKPNAKLKAAGLEGQLYMHLKLREINTVAENGMRSTAGLIKPKTTNIFEGSHEEIFKMVKEELEKGGSSVKTWESDKTKLTLTELALAGVWHTKETGFNHQLHTFDENGNIKFQISSVKTIVKGEDGKLSVEYKTKIATDNKVEFFVHEGEMSSIEALTEKEIAKVEPFKEAKGDVIEETPTKVVDTTNPQVRESVPDVVVE